MKFFLTEVSDNLKDEFHSTILHDNMNISVFMVQLEEKRFKRMSRDANRAKSFDGFS